MIGINAGAGMISGASLNSNTFIGSETGNYQSVGDGNFNILIGARTNLPFATGSYQLNIGNVIYGQNISGTIDTVSSGTTGIGTTSPFARFSIQANDGELNRILFIIASSTSSLNTTLYLVDNKGHHIYGGSTPTISSCGNNSTNIGNDNRGRITAGNGNVTSCTLSFSKTWNTPPVCVLTQESGTPRTFKISPSNSSVIITSSGSIGGDNIAYLCDGF